MTSIRFLLATLIETLLRMMPFPARTGLIPLGHPGPDSPVFVTANYTLSFDALRSALDGHGGFILVLDTKGINVWCASAKGTFSTSEIVRRIESTGLGDVVTHRRLILPQLGAAGVAAHEVPRRSGFSVEYGPVRASDLPKYLRRGGATPEMRRVRFGLLDRLVVVPVEVSQAALPAAVIAGALSLLVGWLSAAAALAAIAAGLVLFPALLPWLPTREFTTKGLILGALAALPFAALAYQAGGQEPWWRAGGGALSILLTLPPVTAFIALNFTGSTTFASRTGVRREIYAYSRVLAALFVAGIALGIVMSLL